MRELSVADRERLKKCVAWNDGKAEEIRTGGFSYKSGPSGNVRDVTAEMLAEYERAVRIREAILKG